MAEFTVTATELNNKAGELERLNKSLEQKIQALEQENNSLASMWEGDAKEALDRKSVV